MTEKQKIQTERTNWIDTARGYGIILVIIGHILLVPDTAWKRGTLAFIYSFHMPLFFIISGYLLNIMKYPFKDFFSKRVKTLLIPYLWIGAIIVLVNWVFFAFGNWSALGDLLLQLFIQKRFHVIWYLLCLFIIEMLLYGIVRLTKDNIVLTGIICTGIFIGGLLYYHFGGTELYWNLDICMTAIFFLFVGYALRRVEFRWDLSLFIASVIINIVCVILNDHWSGEFLEFFGMHYGIIPITILASFSGVYMIFWISHLKPWKSITFIGRYSMIYFGLHQALTVAGCGIVCDANGWFRNRNSFGEGILYTVLVTAFTLLFFTVIQLGILKVKKKIYNNTTKISGKC